MEKKVEYNMITGSVLDVLPAKNKYKNDRIVNNGDITRLLENSSKY